MTWCSTCRKVVPPGHATIIGGSERGSGVPVARYGCTAPPPAPPARAFIGHRGTPPAVVARTA